MNQRSPLAPLRRVVREFTTEEGFDREELECGHIVGRKQDHYGPTNAYRRRCYKCKREHTASLEKVTHWREPLEPPNKAE